MGLSLNSVPQSVAPITTPGLSTSVILSTRTGSSLNLAYDETADAGGSQVTKYKVEWDISSNFDSKFKMEKINPISHKISKVTTVAGTAPLSGTFTLSYGGYIGDFVEVVGGAPTTYSVNVGESYLTKVSGSVSNIHAISRGELIKVAGSIYRVCTDLNMEFTASKIPLATAADASINTTFAGNKNYTTLPIYKPDTSLGCMTLNPAENTITTTWSDGVANDLRKDHNNKGISRGDLIRLGDPYTGDMFRVSTDLTRDFSSTKIPLGTVEDPSVAASFDPEEGRRLDGYPTDQLPIVNRPMYRLQTTSNIPFDATAVQMKNALESMTLIGEVDVSRSINRNGYFMDNYSHVRPWSKDKFSA